MIYVDRRSAGKGKSLPNRQRVIRRVKEFVKQAKPTNIGSGSVGQISQQQVNPVRVASEALEEPRFAYDPESGDSVMIVNGNPKFARGDVIDMNGDEEGDGQGQGGGPGGEGENDFIVNVAADEFLDMFFEDCELPNLTNEKVTDKFENERSHAGFTPNGIPAQLSVIRTYKHALGRRNALGASAVREELRELEEEREDLIRNLSGTTDEEYAKGINLRLTEIDDRMEVLLRKLGAIPAFDKVDLRYRKSEHKPLHTVDAVLVMVMDISYSMGQHEKTVARRWFAMLYAFIKRRYATCDLVFIAHHDEAYELSENDFFATQKSGGTMVSPSLELANKIINERYDSTQTNIYVSYASDGDNWQSDRDAVLMQMKQLLPKIQHFSYVETAHDWSSYYSSVGITQPDTELWETYAEVEVPSEKMSMTIIKQPEEVYEVFKKVFKKK